MGCCDGRIRETQSVIICEWRIRGAGSAVIGEGRMWNTWWIVLSMN